MTISSETPLATDVFSSAFELPDAISDQILRDLHTHMVEDLRQQVSGLPMNTLQQILIERLASVYIQIKWRENTNGWVGVNQQKEMNAYFLSLEQEFRKILIESDAMVKTVLVANIQNIVSETLKLVTNDEERRAVRRELAEKFAVLKI